MKTSIEGEVLFPFSSSPLGGAEAPLCHPTPIRAGAAGPRGKERGILDSLADPSQTLGIAAEGRYFTVTKRNGKVLSAGWTSSMFLRVAQTTACWCSGI